MTDGWKGFFRGIFAALVGALGIILAVLLGRRKPPVGSPQEIAATAEIEIAKKREEIKSDSDEALRDRFNTIAKKETPR